MDAWGRGRREEAEEGGLMGFWFHAASWTVRLAPAAVGVIGAIAYQEHGTFAMGVVVAMYLLGMLVARCVEYVGLDW